MFSFVCSHGVTRKFSWNLNPPKLFCSFQNKKLKISYNNAAPFFSVANNQIVMKTIEGVAIESFITKYNLSVEWLDEEWNWCSKDHNGTYNGMIGRVRPGLCVCLELCPGLILGLTLGLVLFLSNH